MRTPIPRPVGRTIVVNALPKTLQETARGILRFLPGRIAGFLGLLLTPTGVADATLPWDYRVRPMPRPAPSHPANYGRYKSGRPIDWGPINNNFERTRPGGIRPINVSVRELYNKHTVDEYFELQFEKEIGRQYGAELDQVQYNKEYYEWFKGHEHKVRRIRRFVNKELRDAAKQSRRIDEDAWRRYERRFQRWKRQRQDERDDPREEPEKPPEPHRPPRPNKPPRPDKPPRPGKPPRPSEKPKVLPSSEPVHWSDVPEPMPLGRVELIPELVLDVRVNPSKQVELRVRTRMVRSKLPTREHDGKSGRKSLPWVLHRMVTTAWGAYTEAQDVWDIWQWNAFHRDTGVRVVDMDLSVYEKAMLFINGELSMDYADFVEDLFFNVVEDRIIGEINARITAGDLQYWTSGDDGLTLVQKMNAVRRGENALIFGGS